MSARQAVPANTKLDVAVLRVVTLGETLMLLARKRIEEKKAGCGSLTQFMELVALEAALLDSVLQLISFGSVQATFKPQYRQLAKLAGTRDELEGYA